MKIGEIYKFAFNTRENRLFFFSSKNDAILNRKPLTPKVEKINHKVFMVVDQEINPFDSNELIVQILFENKKSFILFRNDMSVSWNQVKKLKNDE